MERSNFFTSSRQVNFERQSHSESIFSAIKSGDIALLKSLIEEGVDIHVKSKIGNTPLYHAIESQNEEILEIVIKHGADVNEEGWDGCRPLCYAIKLKNERIVKILIKHGADIHKEDWKGKTPLYHAVKSGNEAIVKMLIEEGVDIHAENDFEYTLLYYAIKSKNGAIVKILIKHGADIHAKEKGGSGEIPLYYAIKSKNEAIVKILIKHGADIHAKDRLGYSLLDLAIESSNEEIVRMLIEEGADIHAKEPNGYMALSQANLPLAKRIIRTYLIENENSKKPDDLTSELSDFWNKCQSVLKEITESRSYLIKLMKIKDQNELDDMIRGIFKRNAEMVGELKSLLDEEFIDLFGDQLMNSLVRYSRINHSLKVCPRSIIPPLPIEIWFRILGHLPTQDLPTIETLLPIGSKLTYSQRSRG